MRKFILGHQLKVDYNCKILDLGIHQQHCASQGKQHPCRWIPEYHSAHQLSPPHFEEGLSGSMERLKHARKNGLKLTYLHSSK